MNIDDSAKALLIGHFSTFGDLEVLEVVKSWLREEGIPFDVAPYARKIRKGNSNFVDPRLLNAKQYSYLIVVCGPFHQRLISGQRAVFDNFSHCVWIGVNLTMIEAKEVFNPFDVLIERDSNTTSRPDLAISRTFKRVPVVGLCLATKQSEYGDRRRHEEAGRIIQQVVHNRGFASVMLDTRWPPNTNTSFIGNTDQFVSIASKLDLVITTRLHGLVLSLKAKTPVVAIDAISGGDKVSKQADVLGWKEILSADSLSAQVLSGSIDRCLKQNMRDIASEAAQRGSMMEPKLHDIFKTALNTEPRPKTIPPKEPFKRAINRIQKKLKKLRL